jgi:hypothetical protein
MAHLSDLPYPQYIHAGTSPKLYPKLDWQRTRLHSVEVFIAVLTPAAINAIPAISGAEMANGLFTEFGKRVFDGLRTGSGMASAGLGMGTLRQIAQGNVIGQHKINSDMTMQNMHRTIKAAGVGNNCLPYAVTVDVDGNINMSCQPIQTTQNGIRSYGYIFDRGAWATVTINESFVSKTEQIWVS